MTYSILRTSLVLAFVFLLNAIVPDAKAVELSEIMQVNRARTLAAKGDYTSAISVIEDQIRKGEFDDSEELAALLTDVADYLIRAGRFAEGAETYVTLAETVAQTKGVNSPELSPIFENAANAFQRGDSLIHAIDYLNRTLEIDRRYLPCDSQALMQLLSRLADLNGEVGRGDEANRLRSLAEDENARCANKDFNSPVTKTIIDSRERKAPKDSFTQLSVYYATDRARTGSTRPDTFLRWAARKARVWAYSI